MCSGRSRPAPFIKSVLLFPVTVRFDTVIVVGLVTVVWSINTFLMPALVMKIESEELGGPANQLAPSCQCPEPGAIQELGWARTGWIRARAESRRQPAFAEPRAHSFIGRTRGL